MKKSLTEGTESQRKILSDFREAKSDKMFDEPDSDLMDSHCQMFPLKTSGNFLCDSVPSVRKSEMLTRFAGAPARREPSPQGEGLPAFGGAGGDQDFSIPRSSL